MSRARRGTRPFRCRGPRPPRRRARATHARWRATSTARTSGCAATVDTAAVTSGPRISALTSRPSIVVTPSSTRDRALARERARTRGSSSSATPRFERGQRDRAVHRARVEHLADPSSPRRRARSSTSPNPTGRRSRRPSRRRSPLTAHPSTRARSSANSGIRRRRPPASPAPCSRRRSRWPRPPPPSRCGGRRGS